MKKIKKFIVLLIFILFSCSINILAQQHSLITGTVSDENGESLPGVTVVETGTTNGVLTDMDGHYQIRFMKESKTLTFNYMGYNKATLKVGNKSIMDVNMVPSNIMLNETVIVGYGSQKKINLTGSVSSVNFSDKIANHALTNTSTALAGLIAGVTVTQHSGQPGADGASIRIRGNNTLNTNSPLVLVDGIEYSMDDINPNDIKSISVLKDAASTAIYGTRGSNGVILVTTKTGKGKPQINYSSSLTIQSPYNNLNLVSDYPTYMSLVNESCENVGTTNIFSQASIDTWTEAAKTPNKINENGVPYWAAYPNTNWFDEIFETGYSQQHNLSISGSSDKVNYLISAGYQENEGVMNRYNIDSGIKRYNFRTNLEGKVFDWFTIGTRISMRKQENGMANISNGFRYLYQTTPGVFPGYPNRWGSPALASEESSNANNIFYMMAGNTGYNNNYKLNGSVYAKIFPMKGMSIEGTFNYAPGTTDKTSYTRQNGFLGLRK